jgi:aminopeptidase N
MSEQAKTIYLKDYIEPAYEIEGLELTFKLYEDGAIVIAKQTLKRKRGRSEDSLFLNGEDLELKSLQLDGVSLSSSDYQLSEDGLSLSGLPESCVLECETWIKPQENKRLEGLYKSSSMFCTQCEAEGFRRITYYLDRPDVLTVFTTRVEADKSLYPNLLSNGNSVEAGDLDDGRHFVTWYDPFPKPCYLFALVAGDLHCHEGEFETVSGRKVDLRIFVDHKNADKCDYALDCLQRSMKWDEEVYGREYDLDIFMIVAVDDFNMGAMENKGLNIFNSSCVLAKPEATTDAGFQRIEAIVAHEYFHNWSGNRVTCRDWFQLSLKEGFTVFRDAQFSADMNSSVVKRIEDVNVLRTAQFAEDAGPMSHPVRPSSYMEISNFYTLTVYEKGAEVVRMLHTLLGAEQFRVGSDYYFDTHDGKAVTTEDFVEAMEAVSGRDLSQFKLWYDQGGTPELKVVSDYDKDAQTYTLTFQQSCPATPGQETKAPFVIPVSIALLDKQGQGLSLSVAEGGTELVFELIEEQEALVFENVMSEPVPSLLRGFSAPVKLDYHYSDEQLLFLMKHDTDGFNRWEAGQTLALRILQGLIKCYQKGLDLTLPDSYLEAYRAIVKDETLDKAMVCKMLMLPAENYLLQLSDVADVKATHEARAFVREQLANRLHDELMALYEKNQDDSAGQDLSYAAMSKRALKNAALSLLSASRDAESAQSKDIVVELAKQQFSRADNMTDSYSALGALVNSGDSSAAEEALSAFHKQWRDDAQVIELWLSVQASSAEFMNLNRLRELMKLPDFDLTNPNKVRSVVGVYCNQNLINFHEASGAGYEFLADIIIQLDDLNPQIASRLMTPLTRWKQYGSEYQSLMLNQLRRIHVKEALSKDVREVVEKSLA